MGNYIFKTSALLKALEEDAPLETSTHDFGKDIIPTMVKNGGRAFTYDFAKNRVPGEEEGYAYWRDVGTVDAYWAAQMDLVAIQPAFNLYNQRWPIRTGHSHDPPAKFVFRDEANARVGIATESLVSLGCIVSGGRIHRSVLSNGVRVNSFSHIEECVIFENVVIGRHAKIRRAIIDKDVEIPAGTEIGYNLAEDKKRWYVSEGGIVVIPKRAKLDHVQPDASMPRTVIVGDVHGCRAELEALLARVAFGTGDRLVMVGDLVVRGPDPAGTLDLLASLGARAVRGNHEDRLLRCRVSHDGAPLGAAPALPQPPGMRRSGAPSAPRSPRWRTATGPSSRPSRSGSTCPSTASAWCTPAWCRACPSSGSRRAR